jgi:mono/diheme cytochrome c family protein
MIGTAALVAATVWLAPHAAAQTTPIDGALLESGKQIYAAQCALCHQPNGDGMQPEIPNLARNNRVVNIDTLVANVRDGQRAMPSFSNLSAEQIASVATYVRNTWGNSFGGVSVAQVEASIARLGAAPPRRSVWTGVYTREQATRGLEHVVGACIECHGERLDGAAADPDRKSTPPIARARFLRNWEGRSVLTLFSYLKNLMPPASPGFLTDAQYLEVVAHILAVSNVPPGSTELKADLPALSVMILTQQP